jgi:hypothetical protein
MVDHNGFVLSCRFAPLIAHRSNPDDPSFSFAFVASPGPPLDELPDASMGSAIDRQDGFFLEIPATPEFISAGWFQHHTAKYEARALAISLSS